MKAKTYNDAWSSIEFLMFEHMDMTKVASNAEEKAKLEREYVAARTVILKKFGVTYEELSAETDRIMEELNGK